ncbi:hypothetical protein PHYBOEH_001165 [Phytophthora boehmeriae]|uniref:Uncharacterized protein n=1 Tax=Phytophthora boehmeriae TaxID=109152 RepID=A0A8T1WVP0_9STRA|nr:hypothetical protein PHYBOEH_001165 [Phytophthora boehmeriae]
MMATLERALEPELVLCSACLESEEHESLWLPLRCGADNALLVRDVCVRRRCPRLQVRGHFCVEHVLEFELSWRNHYAVRACTGCRVSSLQLYAEKRELWFILAANEHSSKALGVERRLKAPSSASSDGPASLVQLNAKRPLGKRQRRRSTRCIKQHGQKEQVLAWEWSLGNLPLAKSKHLWRDNRKRLEVEKDPAAYYAAMKRPAKQAPDPYARPQPADVFCATLGCTRYAKTGDRCRFHSSGPLPIIRAVENRDPAAAASTSTK